MDFCNDWDRDEDAAEGADVMKKRGAVQDGGWLIDDAKADVSASSADKEATWLPRARPCATSSASSPSEPGTIDGANDVGCGDVRENTASGTNELTEEAPADAKPLFHGHVGAPGRGEGTHEAGASKGDIEHEPDPHWGGAVEALDSIHVGLDSPSQVQDRAACNVGEDVDLKQLQEDAGDDTRAYQDWDWGDCWAGDSDSGAKPETEVDVVKVGPCNDYSLGFASLEEEEAIFTLSDSKGNWECGDYSRPGSASSAASRHDEVKSTPYMGLVTNPGPSEGRGRWNGQAALRQVSRRSTSLVQGTLTKFLGLKRKECVGVPAGGPQKVQQGLNRYFSVTPAVKVDTRIKAEVAVVKFPPAVVGLQQRGQRDAGAGTLKFDWLAKPPALKAGAKESRHSGKGPSGAKPSRSCPFYKKMPGTTFTVDAFKFGAIPGCSAYFLTHFHSDHYGGLTKAWSHGPIFCTPVTARLVSLCLRVDSQWLRPVPMGNSQLVEGVEVTFMPANHCPGAALVLFRLPDGTSILHTGDFRANRAMQNYPHLVQTRIDTLYLDTTYCSPRYSFPPQEEVIEFVIRTVRQALERTPRLLIAVGAYSIGKERVYLAIALALGVKIFVDGRRKRVLSSLDWPQLEKRLTLDPTATPLHVLPIWSLNPLRLQSYLQQQAPRHSAALGFRPTGWTFNEKLGSNLHLLKPQAYGPVTVYGVPYSEHSSFAEMRDFVQFLQPGKIIPTVNVGTAAERDRMQALFRQWQYKVF